MIISSTNSYSDYYYDLSLEQKTKISEYLLNESISIDSDEETTVNNSSTQTTSSLEDIQASMMSQAPNGGPPPPPPAKSEDEMINSLIDADEDDLWSAEELSAFSESLADTVGTSFDAEEVMEKYDVNGDGVIDASERKALLEDNAFNLLPPKEVEEVDEEVNEEVNEEVDEEQLAETSNISDTVIKAIQAIQAYDFSINIIDRFPENLFDSKAV